MFDKFGKMSYDELIRTAKAEKEEGDEEALIGYCSLPPKII